MCNRPQPDSGCVGKALELAPFLEAILGNVTGLVGGVLGGLGRRLRIASVAVPVPVNVYFIVNRIGGAGPQQRPDTGFILLTMVRRKS